MGMSRRRLKMLKPVMYLLGFPFLFLILYWYQPPSCEEGYFSPREQKQISLNYNYVHDASNLCSASTNGSDVYTRISVVILVLTVSQHVSERQAIRQTYGSVGRGKQWPGTKDESELEHTVDTLGELRVVFLMGQTKDDAYKVREAELVAAESREHGDVVQWEELVEDYSNLTLKVLLGMRWVRDRCPRVTHVVKTDDDVFIHVPRLLHYIDRHYPKLRPASPPAKGSANQELQNSSPSQFHAGWKNISGAVSRTYIQDVVTSDDVHLSDDVTNMDVIHGAWLGAAVAQENYGKYNYKILSAENNEAFPFRVLPLNVKGALYLMHVTLVVRMLSVAEHMPYSNLEDVHVTGILACVVRARHVGFSMAHLDFCNTDPKPCDFADDVRIASRDVTPAMFGQIWGTFSHPDACSSFLSGLLSFAPGFLRFPKCVFLPR